MTLQKTTINEFTKEFRFLSNFYPSTVAFEGKLYKTVEHAYQASKTSDPDTREFIRNLKTPGETKRFAKTIILREDWHSIKFKIMKELLVQKFNNPFIKPLLLATETATLIETNTWHDIVWGLCHCKNCKGQGENMMGRLLEEVRDELSKV